MYLLDTNVVSEVCKKRPNPAVGKWLSGLKPGQMFLSVTTIGEIQYGVEKIREIDPVRSAEFEAWIDDLTKQKQTLPITVEVMRQWGKLRANHPDPTKFFDLLIAATAMVHGLTLATRNIRDFQNISVDLTNPFDGDK